MFSNGSRSQMGSSRPAASQKRDSRCDGSSAISCSQSMRHCASSARRQLEASSSARAMVSRVAGRTRRTRSCTPPSSNIREGAGSRTAARFERALTNSLGLPSGPGSRSPMARAVSAVVGSSRSRRRISTSSVAAPVPGCSYSVSRPARTSESARTVSTPTSKVPASTACSIFSAMRASSSAKSSFCSSMGSASRRLRNRDMGGRSSLRLPSWTSLRPVASSNRAMAQPVNAAAPEREVEAPQRRLGVGALEVVALAEERRVAPAHGGLAESRWPLVIAPRLNRAGARWWR